MAERSASNGQMTIRLAIPLVALAAVAPIAAQQPVFPVSIESVAVDVSVTRRGQPISGLTASDFELLDNRVPQTIADISSETLPIDLTFVIDVSGAAEGPLLDSVQRGVSAVTSRLRAEDCASLVGFDRRIQEVVGVCRPDVTIASNLEASGGS